jgi:hypothetical protein
MVMISAEGTGDPDGDDVSVKWYLYPEAGTMRANAMLSTGEGLATEVTIPQGATGSVHVILDAQDNGNPPLSAYRRAVLEVVP